MPLGVDSWVTTRRSTLVSLPFARMRARLAELLPLELGDGDLLGAHKAVQEVLTP